MLANDTELARFNMVAQQVRPCEVINERVLDALQEVPREHFVDDAYRSLAFADIHVPLANGECMMKPIQEARMLQALAVKKSDRVLEIGTGSGFVTACLAKLGDRVTSIEIDAELYAQASKRLDALRCNNANVQHGDIFNMGFADQIFDAIAVTGSLPVAVDLFGQWLAPGGRMFAIIGEGRVMHATLTQRAPSGELIDRQLFETELPPLHNAPQKEQFTF